MALLRRLVAPLLVVGCVLAAAASASAATVAGTASSGTNPFGCRASVARVDLGGTDVLEPTVANTAGTPCATDSALLTKAQVLTAGTQSLTVGPAGAFTFYSPEQVTPIGNIAPGAAATASIKAVNIPTSNGTITIVGPVEADARMACVNDKVQSYGQSTLDIIYVNNTKHTLPAPGKESTIPLGGGAYIKVNEKIATPTSITERVLDVHLANGTDIVVGEAQVSATSLDACAGTSGGPPSLGVCPAGTTLSVTKDYCILTEKTPGGGTKIVYVSRPFKGPSGGKVISIVRARHLFPHSPCVRGKGPQWALVATRVAARVLGTEKSDRIFAKGRRERVWAKEGNDCIDGMASRQHLWDGDGRDRMYAGPGFSHDGLGDGNSLFKGRRGHVWFQGGDGNDRVYAGRGKSRLDLGSGHNHVFGGPSNDRIFVLGAHREKVSCGGGTRNVAFLRPRAIPYARAHGCQVIHVLGGKRH